MMNVYLAQVNNSYGRNVFLPYSAGMLQAYAQSIPEIREAFDFKGFVYSREPIDQVIARMDEPAVFGCSCYIWNWSYTTALAKAVKEAFPKCLIILGGPHVPVKSDTFFQRHPWADLLIHYEGEITFAEVLGRLSLDSIVRNIGLPNHGLEYIFTGINGLSIRSDSGKAYKTSDRERVANLDQLPSPYLAGIFNELIADDRFDWHASQETHRGCPYSCTFCDWGSNTLAKVKRFSDERLKAEMDWFAAHKIEMVYNCDANYGLFERDIGLIEYMASLKERTGYPKKFRAAYAKNSNDTVYRIASILNSAGMNKGITLSFQSMDDNTLEIVKRKNIKIQDFKSLMTRYRREGIATYSEIIIGLPGETYDSFANGLEKLLQCGQHDSIQVYNCEVLPNAEMNQPEYRQEHEIKSVEVPVLFFHGTPAEDPHQEMYELVVSTKTLPPADWLKCHRFAWAVQCFHCLSLTQAIAVFLYHYAGVSYRRFYENVLDYADTYPGSTLGFVTKKISRLFEGIRNGAAWGVVDQRFGNIIWPPEEGGFLKFVVNDNLFYNDLREILRGYYQLVPVDVVNDLISYQKRILMRPLVFSPRASMTNIPFRLGHNLPEYIEAACLGEPIDLASGDFAYNIDQERNYPSLADYAREVVWYGRKGGKFQHSVKANNSGKLAWIHS